MDRQNVGTQLDLLQYLWTDILACITSLLDDPVDIVRLSCVSHFWHGFVVSNGLAKKLCLKVCPQLADVVHTDVMGDNGLPRVVDDSDEDAEEKIQRKDHVVYAALLLALTRSKASATDCITHAVCASSTDQYPFESIVNTLNPGDRDALRPSYWSSGGQSNPEVPEMIIYRLKPITLVITEVDIVPFQAYFQPGNPIYSAKSVRIRVGCPKPQNEIKSEIQKFPFGQPTEEMFTWNYTSPEFPMKQENCLQQFKLPEPVLCAEGYLQIELLGRVQRQEADGLFYICVCYTRALGHQLYPAFEFEIDATDGKKLLEYYPEHLGSILQDNPQLQAMEEVLVRERTGLLEIVMNRLRRRRNNQLLRDLVEE